MADIFLMLILDSLLYFLLACYIDLVRPGKWGITRPWYFPFQISFWAESVGIPGNLPPVSPPGMDLNRNENCEELKLAQAGFRLENIVKTFKMKGSKERRKVVDKLSFQVNSEIDYLPFIPVIPEAANWRILAFEKRFRETERA